MESIGRADAGLMEDFWSPPTPTSISAAGKLTRKQRAKLPAYFNAGECRARYKPVI
jgi:hypothetical protein